MINIYCKSFEELSNLELYDILSLREQVFIVEQSCPYQDADGLDKSALHVSLYFDNDLAAYARILPKGLSYNHYVAIGRVVSSPKYRGKGYGIKLFQKVMEISADRFPGQTIKLSAQTYIQRFYQQFGFEAIGDVYLEDDIPHIAMVYKY